MDADPRAELELWQAARAANFYDATPSLARSLRVRLGDEGLRALEPGLRAFGETVATVLEPSVRALELRPPSLEPADPLGRESQDVTFDPEYARAGRAVWASGVAAAPAFEQAALLYLLAHAGEGGHTCPVVCTAGLIRALRQYGSPELQERFLRAAAGARLRPLPARSAVPDGGAGRLRRRRQPRRGGARRRGLADLRREVVLLGRRRGPVPAHRAAARRTRGHARDRLLPRSTPPPRWVGERVPAAPPEGQARHTGARHRRDRVHGRARIRRSGRPRMASASLPAPS